MCDPISIGIASAALTVGGSVAQNYSQDQVAGKQASLIGEERQRQAELRTQEQQRQAAADQKNKASVAETLNTYSRPKVEEQQAQQTGVRQQNYVAPIGDTSAYAAPLTVKNQVIADRNAAIAAPKRAKTVAEALAKGKLDAFGDAGLMDRVAASRNANDIATLGRYQSASLDQTNKAMAASQNVLPLELTGAKTAGSTWGSIGDALTLAGQVAGYGSGMVNGSGGSLSDWAARNNVPFLGKTYSPNKLFGGFGGGVYTKTLAPIPMAPY